MASKTTTENNVRIIIKECYAYIHSSRRIAFFVLFSIFALLMLQEITSERVFLYVMTLIMISLSINKNMQMKRKNMC